MATKESVLKPWIVCFTAALFFFYEFIQMNMFNTISDDLMRAFSINATGVGQLSAYYFYANLLFFPVAGLLLDRFSTRKIILITLSICAVGIGLFALTRSLPLACFFRAISGIGSAFCFLSSIRLASRWFPAKRMALVSALIVTMAMIGGMVAQTPLTLLKEAVGWRNALLLDSALGFFIIGLVYFAVVDYPANYQQEYKDQQALLKKMGIWQSLRLAYLNIQNWLGGFYTCLLNLPLALLGAIWGSLYLQQVHHFSATQASFATSLLFAGTIIGGPVVGWFSDRIQRRILPLIMGAILSLVLVLVFIYVPDLSFTAYLLLFFGLGFITSSQVISYPLITENNSKMLTASSVSVISFCAISGYAIFQPVFGWLMDLHWQGTVVDNVHIYSITDFQRALWILPIGFIIALFFTFFLRETHCQRKE